MLESSTQRPSGLTLGSALTVAVCFFLPFAVAQFGAFSPMQWIDLVFYNQVSIVDVLFALAILLPYLFCLLMLVTVRVSLSIRTPLFFWLLIGWAGIAVVGSVSVAISEGSPIIFTIPGVLFGTFTLVALVWLKIKQRPKLPLLYDVFFLGAVGVFAWLFMWIGIEVYRQNTGDMAYGHVLSLLASVTLIVGSAQDWNRTRTLPTRPLLPAE